MSETAIRTSSLARHYGGLRALEDVSLSVPSGAICGLIGPNGAGKTTLFGLLCGFLSPTSGSAEVLGADPRDRRALGSRVAALPQDAPLPNRLNILDAVTYWAEAGGTPSRQARTQAAEALEAVGLGRDLAKRCGELSHGMGKRVALAQALVGTPDLILLDEPTAGLDPRSQAEVKQLVRDRRGRATVVISSHDLAQLEELCDHVAILDHGKLVTQGDLASVVGRGELLRIELAIADGSAFLAALASVKEATGPRWNAAARTIEVRISGSPPEVAVPAVLRALLTAGAPVIAVARGQRLEERVLQLT